MIHSLLTFSVRQHGLQYKMAKLLWFYLLIASSSLQLSSSLNWWSPYQWREYWEDWWQKRHIERSEGIPQRQQGEADILPNDEG